jgi:hypothetical protein
MVKAKKFDCSVGRVTIICERLMGPAWPAINAPFRTSPATGINCGWNISEKDVGISVGEVGWGSCVEPEKEDKRSAATSDGGKSWRLIARALLLEIPIAILTFSDIGISSFFSSENTPDRSQVQDLPVIEK